MSTSITKKEGTKVLATITIIAMAAVLSALPYQNQVANAAPTIKTIEVTDGGDGTFICSGETFSLEFFNVQIDATVNKITGKLTGTWQILSDEGDMVAEGTITDGKTKRNSFILSGTETDNFNPGGFCAEPPILVTITGQCGTDVGISFSAAVKDGKSQSAQINHVSVSCTR
jgi:hypothetical protein